MEQMPYPCSHFYVDINFGNRVYSKEKRPGSLLLFLTQSVAKFDINVKLTIWIGQEFEICVEQKSAQPDQLLDLFKGSFFYFNFQKLHGTKMRKLLLQNVNINFQ